MAINTYQIVLKAGTSAEALEQLVCIKDFPDLGGTPELIETTTLCDEQQTYIQGIKSSDVMEFTANYTNEDYEKVANLAGEEMYYALEFGENGKDGVFQWEGAHSVRVSGAGVNEVVEMVISIAPSTPIVKVAGGSA